jgi:hypothetical protein
MRASLLALVSLMALAGVAAADDRFTRSRARRSELRVVAYGRGVHGR